MSESNETVWKGLAGVVADETSISKVNPDTNSLLYRGYPVQQLAQHTPFEDVAWLLWHGELPTAKQRDAFVSRERGLRDIPDVALDTIAASAPHAHPMDIVRTVVSILGTLDPDVDDDSPAGQLAKAEKLFACLPTIVAAIQRLRSGQSPVAPRSDLDYCENFLWMSFGEVPDATVVDVFRMSMVLYAEHSFNASTFTARVITSTLSDLYSAVTGAIGALKGHLHGGANEAVIDVFDEIGVGDGVDKRVSDWLDEAFANKRKIMGFGHRVYKSGDSRVPTMREGLGRIVELTGHPEVLDLYEALEAQMTERKGILPNLDFPSGPCYQLMGFDTPVFTPLFVAARITGWTAHIMEQRAANALIRPLSAYVGPGERSLPGHQ